MTRQNSLPTANMQFRHQMLRNVYTFWIEGVLENSLHGAALIELGKRQNAGFVKNPWDMRLRLQSGDALLPHETHIANVFDDLDCRLLILGDPGSGKTTTLLELTEVLLERAERDPDHPIPVVLNLSSWAKERKPLADWMIDELNTKYQVSRKIGVRWIHDNHLLLLLDGLDEVNKEARNACVEAINIYQHEHGHPAMAVCSRIHDYSALTSQLELNGAVVIQPMNDVQIADYLESLGDETATLRELLAQDDALHELARTPLSLSIMTLAYRGLHAEDIPDFATLDEQRAHLFEMYVQRMFERRIKTKEYPADDTVHYVSWLAERMVERQQTVFHIEGLQMDWLATRWEQSLYKLLSRLLYGLSVGAIAGGIAAFVVSVLLMLLAGQSLSLYREGGSIYGLPVLVILTFTGIIAGMLTGGIAMGAAGLGAYAEDRLTVKSTERGYHQKNILGILGIGTAVGAVFTLMTALLVWLLNGNLTWHTSDGTIAQGLIAVGYLLPFGMGFGLATGAIASVAGMILQKLNRQLNHLSYGIAGGFTLLAYVCVIGVIQGIYVGPGIFLSFFVIWLVGALVGVLAGNFKDKIEISEALGWRWNWKWAGIGLACAAIAMGLDYLGTSAFSTYDWGRAFMMFTGFASFGVLAGGIGAGLRRKETVDNRTQPNEGIRRSAWNVLKVTAVFGLVGILIACAVLGLTLVAEFIAEGGNLALITLEDIGATLSIFRDAGIVGLASGLAAGLVIGGTDTIVKHVVLRFLLRWVDDTPKNYADFLDHVASLILLRKVGGGYIFMHRYLLEYFAGMEAEKSKNNMLDERLALTGDETEDEPEADDEPENLAKMR